MAISWSVTGTILAAYYIGGVRFFGPVFLGLWASIIIIGILVIEKLGYGRNFEGWDFPLRKTIALPLAFGLVLAVLYLIIAIGCALAYLDFRFAERQWRRDHAQLARWHATFAARASVRATEPVDDA